MSGISNKCFHLPNTIENGGDYIKKKKQKTLYRTLSNNVTYYNDSNPLKKRSRYNDLYGVSMGIDCSGGVLTYAKNYDLLLDITKGKHYTDYLNSDYGLNTDYKWQMWAGNTYLVDYNEKNIDPLKFITIDSSGSNKINSYNSGKLPYQPYDYGDSSTDIDYPGFIVDASNVLFYTECKELTQTPSWNKFVDISFNDTNYFWKGKNSEPLQGFNYPRKINIFNEINDDCQKRAIN